MEKQPGSNPLKTNLTCYKTMEETPLMRNTKEASTGERKHRSGGGKLSKDIGPKPA